MDIVTKVPTELFSYDTGNMIFPTYLIIYYQQFSRKLPN